MRVSLASFIRSFRLNVGVPLACRTGAWDAGTDSVLPQRSPHGPEGIHRILRQATGGTSEREHTLPDFLWNYDSPVPSITNFKIVSAIRNEIASRLDIDSFQELLASH